MKSYRHRSSGFTLVEILIVVIILGILAAIVIPQFTNASQDARKSSLTSQLQTLRSQVELYKLQHLDAFPPSLIDADAEDPWTEMTQKTDEDHTANTAGRFGPYLQAAPVNPLNGLSTVAIVTEDVDYLDTVDSAGWVLNTANGKIWATAVDSTVVFDESNPAAPENTTPGSTDE